MIRNWKPEAFKAQLKADLIANGEIAGKFVEEEARKNLLAITNPEWGAGYRRQIVARLLSNEVEDKGNMVEIRVGVKVSKDGRHHGFYIETGSSTAPAHPFLRPAVFGNGARIVAILAGG